MRISPKAQTLLEQSRGHRSAGRIDSAIAALENAVRGPGADDLTTHDRAALLRDLAELRLAQGAWELAHEHLDDALMLIGDADARRDHRELWAAISERKAFTLFRQSRLGHAREIAQSIHDELQESGDAGTLAAVHNTLAGVAWEQGRIEDAARHVVRAVQLYERAGDAHGLSIANTNRGIVLFSAGETEEAVLALAELDGPSHDRARRLVNLAQVERAANRRDRARRLLEEALDTARELRERYIESRVHLAFAELEMLDANLDAAREHLEALGPLDSLPESERAEAAAIMECGGLPPLS